MTETRATKGTVYLASKPKRSFQTLANAECFGQIKYIFEWNNYEQFLANYWRQFRLIDQMLQDFDPDLDYFVPIGDVTTTVVCVAYLSELCRGQFKMLIWNPKIKQYEPLEVDVGDHDDDEDGEDDGDGGEALRGGGATGAAR
jgi:hypothetical protein